MSLLNRFILLLLLWNKHRVNRDGKIGILWNVDKVKNNFYKYLCVLCVTTEGTEETEETEEIIGISRM